MFGDDEEIRSDKDLAEDYRRGMESQDRMIADYQRDNEALRAERDKLRDAIRRAGFEVCQTSGEWMIHDVSEYGKAEEAKSLEVANENVTLTVERNKMLCDMPTAHKRKCRDCGNVAWHADNVTPYVICRKCGSQDTRKVSP
jgi:hypothetical protein